MAGLTLDIGANTREAVKGARDVADAMEQISDKLDPLAKDGGKVGDKLADGLQDGRKEADKLERSFKDLAQAAQRQSKSAGDDIGDNIKRGTDDARDGLKRAEGGLEEFKSEANSTAKESAASFDGSAESIGDSFQEVAANAFAGFGPAGAVAGIAAAAGIGVVLTAIQEQQAALDALKQKFADAYQTAAEEGRNYLDQAQVDADVLDVLFNTDRANEWKQVQEDAKVLGVDALDLARANAGDQEALNGLLDLANDKRDEAISKADEEGGIIYETLGPLSDVTRRLQEHKELNDDNIARANTLLQYQGQQARAQLATKSTVEGTAGAFATVDSAIRNLPKALTIPVGADLSPADRAVANWRSAQQSINIVVNAVDSLGKKLK